jgi:Fur family transcriptional regulator, ferric uptake regulator
MERHTRQRAAIREVVSQTNRPLLAQEVLEYAQVGMPSLGLATVYRTLKALVDEGELKLVHLPGENPRYEVAVHDHHHHFQCTRCQRVFDVYACPGDLSKLAPRGFIVEDHELTLYGHCNECTAERSTALR